MNYTLECCVDSVESAIIATEAGADRLELCANLIIGGTTPSLSLFSQIKKKCSNRIHVLIRPRFGDFCYTEDELEIMCDEIKNFRQLGADGIVIGVLSPDGTVNWEAMDRLIHAAGDMWITLHRAFDVCKDPYGELENCILHGVSCILTSGQKNKCTEGISCLNKLVKQAEDRIQILIGSGVNAQAIAKVHKETGANAYHMSGKEDIDSPMVYRNTNVYMGLDGLDEYTIWRTKKEHITEAIHVLRLL